ncbi:MAG: hypothetical protein AAFY42_09585 [Pseudomonadota bacterium]
MREQILAAVETLCGTVEGVAEVERMPSGDPASFPALHIFDQGDEPAQEEEETDTEAFWLQIGIDGYVTESPASTAANALYAALKEILMAHPPIGGIAEEIRQGRLDMAVAERAKDHRLGFGVEFNILYRTRFGRPQEIG